MSSKLTDFKIKWKKKQTNLRYLARICHSRPFIITKTTKTNKTSLWNPLSNPTLIPSSFVSRRWVGSVSLIIRARATETNYARSLRRRQNVYAWGVSRRNISRKIVKKKILKTSLRKKCVLQFVDGPVTLIQIYDTVQGVS